MMQLIKMLIVGSVVFAASAAGSHFLQSKIHATADAQHEDSADSHESDGSELHSATAAESHPSSPGDATPTAVHVPQGTADELPIVVRPAMLTPEDILRNAMSLRTREEQLEERERAAEQEHMRLQLVQADIQTEQSNLDALAAEVKSQMDAAQHLLARITEERNQLEQERQRSAEQLKQFEETRSEMDAIEQQNLKRLSSWVQGMEATTAAAFIRELADDGKMDVAVQLLANFEEREAAKILEAINDPALMVELTDKFRTLKRPKKTATR